MPPRAGLLPCEGWVGGGGAVFVIDRREAAAAPCTGCGGRGLGVFCDHVASF